MTFYQHRANPKFSKHTERSDELRPHSKSSVRVESFEPSKPSPPALSTRMLAGVIDILDSDSAALVITEIMYTAEPVIIVLCSVAVLEKMRKFCCRLTYMYTVEKEKN